MLRFKGQKYEKNGSLAPARAHQALAVTEPPPPSVEEPSAYATAGTKVPCSGTQPCTSAPLQRGHVREQKDQFRFGSVLHEEDTLTAR